MQAQTIGSDAKAATLLRQMKEAANMLPTADDAVMERVAVLVSCTTAIDFNFDGGEHEALRQFRALWDSRSTDARAFATGLLTVPHTLVDHWHVSFRQAQLLDDLDPAQLPADRLPPILRQEASDPASFFSAPASVSPPASSKGSPSSGTAGRQAKTAKASSAPPSP